ncbi:hypothetical protein NL676_007066 [Syzygium grande]|nr:hypothetical protein NL676_007066 [Syzygium grande]
MLTSRHAKPPPLSPLHEPPHHASLPLSSPLAVALLFPRLALATDLSPPWSRHAPRGPSLFSEAPFRPRRRRASSPASTELLLRPSSPPVVESLPDRRHAGCPDDFPPPNLVFLLKSR